MSTMIAAAVLPCSLPTTPNRRKRSAFMVVPSFAGCVELHTDPVHNRYNSVMDLSARQIDKLIADLGKARAWHVGQKKIA